MPTRRTTVRHALAGALAIAFVAVLAGSTSAAPVDPSSKPLATTEGLATLKTFTGKQVLIGVGTNPTGVADLGATVLYTIGNLAAGKSKTMTVAYDGA